MITRIRELLETRQLTPTQFADLIGVGRPVISHILSERNKPSLEVVQKIIGAFPDVSLPWLLTGTGSMQAAAAPDTLSSAVATPVAAPAAAPVVPQPVAPTPIQSQQVPQATHNTAVTTASAPRPAPLPLPPKFRPGTKATSQPIVSSPGPAPSPTIRAAPVEVPTPAPIATPMPEAAAATTPVPVAPAPTLVPSPALAAPPVAPSLGNSLAADSPVAGTPALAQMAPPASTPVAEPTVVPAVNQAAALSFLGEPGKAIRRIVIFYRDGSFSDYVPEGF
jgi:DNA-binding XRE family transcriptional regulator